jgi:hypothetical protein
MNSNTYLNVPCTKKLDKCILRRPNILKFRELFQSENMWKVITMFCFKSLNKILNVVYQLSLYHEKYIILDLLLWIRIDWVIDMLHVDNAYIMSLICFESNNCIIIVYLQAAFI